MLVHGKTTPSERWKITASMHEINKLSVQIKIANFNLTTFCQRLVVVDHVSIMCTVGTKNIENMYCTYAECI